MIIKYVEKHFHTSHKGHRLVHFAKSTKNDPNYSKPNSTTEIEDNTNATDTDNDDMFLHMNLSDLKMSSDNSDL